MERRKFDASRSSNIGSIEYDGSELLVEFKKGSVYAYSDVPEEVFDAFVEHFINTGYVDATFKSLVLQAKQEGEHGN